MSGNVWEWVQDTYAEDAYKRHGRKNPIYEEESGLIRVSRGDLAKAMNEESGGSIRVLRGGSWGGLARDARCAFRYGIYPSYEDSSLGFRVVAAPPVETGVAS